MAISFPSNPQNGDTISSGGVTWTFNSSKSRWENNIIGMAGGSLTVAADSGSNDNVTIGSDTLTFAGASGITTTVSDNQISIDLDDTAVTAGTYGTAATVPRITVDAQGRITAISEAGNVPAGNINVTSDTSTNSTHYVTFASGTSGSVTLKAASNLTYNPSTGYITATNLQGSFIGNVTGNLEGNVVGNVTGNITGTVTGGASSASTVNVSNNSTASDNMFLVFADGATGVAESLEGDPQLRFKPSTNTLTVANINTTEGLLKLGSANGTVDSVVITSAGAGYSEAPTVNITGNGDGATATATIGGGQVTGVTITNAGAGYTSASVTFSGGSPSSIATGTVSLVSSDGIDTDTKDIGFYGAIDTTTGEEVSSITLNNLTEIGGYTSAPTITVGAPPSGGTQAVAAATYSNNRITAITLSNRGAGYTSAPTITVGAPDKATMTFAVPGDVSTANNTIGPTSGHASSWYPVGTKMVYSKGSATDPLNGFVDGNTYYVKANNFDTYKIAFTTAATNSGSGATISIGTISSDEHASDHTFTVQTPTATSSLVSNQYSGLFRDASDDKWKFFKGLEASPTGSAVDITGTGYTADTVVANLEGNVTGDVSGSSGSTTGNAATATKLSSNRTFRIQGEVTGNVTSDLTSGFTIDNSAVGSDTIDADNLKVTGNGSAGNVLQSDGDGTFSWGQSLRTTDSPTFADVTASSLDISGDVDVDGTLETDALTIGGATLESVVEGFFSASDAGGDGSFSYSNGVFTYTGPSASEVRAHISGGTGVTVSSGEIAIGQAVATTDDVTFADVNATGNVTITGNLDVNGTTTTLDTTNSTITDRLIELGTGTTGTPANDMGIVLERGSSDNAFIGWDESADKFLMGTGSFTGASTGNLTVTTGTLVANLEGNVTGNLTGTADLATSVTATANNTTDETVYLTFVDGATGTQGIETDTGLTYNPSSGALSIENADAGSSAGPVLTLYRNSASPADADYLGQIKFSGEDDGGATTVYSKITGKAGDVTNSTEDGVIEFAAQKAGTQTILARLLSTKLELINSTALDVDGAVTAASLDISGNADIDGTMEADAYTVDGTALNEYIADTVGAMFTGNTETGISASYEDADNTIDLVVADVALGSGTSGNYVAGATAGTGIAVSGSAGEGWSPTIALSHLGLESLSDPDADKFLIWDDSAGATAFATLGDGLSSDGTTINGIAVYNASGTKLN